MIKFRVLVLSTACLFITGCAIFTTKPDIVDFNDREIDRIEIYKRNPGKLDEPNSYPPWLKYADDVIHFTSTDLGKYDDLSDGLSKLNPCEPGDGFLIGLWLYCEIHFLDGSIKGIELHPGGYVKFEGKSYKDSSETVSTVIESMFPEDYDRDSANSQSE